MSADRRWFSSTRKSMLGTGSREMPARYLANSGVAGATVSLIEKLARDAAEAVGQ